MDSDSDKYINSVLLCTNEKKKNEKEKLKLIDYLLYKFKDKKQLLSKLKILSIKNKIDITYNVKLHCENEVEDAIMTNIFAYLDYKACIFPDDILGLIRKNDKGYRNIVNWYFMNVEHKKSDRIIRQLIENIYIVEDCVGTSKKSDVFSATETVDINNVDIKLLEEFDRQLQKHFSVGKNSNNEDKMIANRTISVIKTILTKNNTRNIKLYKTLHDNDLAEKELMKIYFKNLKTNRMELFTKKYIKYLKSDINMLIYLNNVVRLCERNGCEFDWKSVCRLIAENSDTIDFVKICYDKIPFVYFYKSLKNSVDIQRIQKLAKKIIKSDHDIDQLKKYSKRYSFDKNLTVIKEFMNKRIVFLYKKYSNK